VQGVGSSAPGSRQQSAWGDRLFLLSVRAAAIVFFAIFVALVAELVQGSWLSLQTFGLKFFVTSEWNPVTEKFGALPLIFGTVVSSLIALLLAGALGILAAAYLADFAPRFLARPLAFAIELLAAVPSVVFGLWGLFVLAPIMRDTIDPLLSKTLGFLPLFSGPSLGLGLLTAGVLLALMIVPTVTAISRDVIVAIPVEQREASYALGSTGWETMVRVVLPAARAGIIGALILALGRALGETIAVTMVIGNRPQIAASLFAPSYTLASVIANEFTEATGNVYLSALAELGLLLLIISLIVNGIARLLVWSVFRKAKRAA
jgi:phosphate transport system permease protein